MPDLEKIAPELRREASGPHWSKDYVEHLRTIHFSLIGLSLAALVLAFSPNPDEIKKAREQINAVDEVTRTWNFEWIGQAAAQAVDDFKKESDLQGVTDIKFASGFVPEPKEANAVTGSEFGSNTCAVRFTTPNWIISGPIRRYSQQRYNGGPPWRDADFSPREVYLATPKTLEEFRNLWSTLNEKQRIQFPLSVSKDTYVAEAFTGLRTQKAPGAPLEWRRLASETSALSCLLPLELRPLRDGVKAQLPNTPPIWPMFFGDQTLTL